MSASPPDKPRVRHITLNKHDTSDMRAIAGSNRDHLNNWVMCHAMENQWVAKGSPEEKHVDTARAALLGMMEFAPRNGVEGMIASLFMSHYGMAQECARRAQIDGQPREGAALLRKGAAQSTRICLELLDALDRRRGKGRKQNITVKHLYVNDGSQAVIGNFGPGGAGGGGGDESAIEGEAHAQGYLAGQSTEGVGMPALRSPDPERRPLPIPSDAERPVPDARRRKHRAKRGGV